MCVQRGGEGNAVVPAEKKVHKSLAARIKSKLHVLLHRKKKADKAAVPAPADDAAPPADAATTEPPAPAETAPVEPTPAAVEQTPAPVTTTA